MKKIESILEFIVEFITENIVVNWQFVALTVIPVLSKL